MYYGFYEFTNVLWFYCTLQMYRNHILTIMFTLKMVTQMAIHQKTVTILLLK